MKVLDRMALCYMLDALLTGWPTIVCLKRSIFLTWP